MGWGLPTWLGGSPAPAPPARPKSSDGGFVAPDRNSRELCYESRDNFFNCLDKNDILDAIKEDDKARKVCAKEMTDFERDCARTWVSISSGLSSMPLGLTEDIALDQILQGKEGNGVYTRSNLGKDTTG